jgi:hypothetical protein
MIPRPGSFLQVWFFRQMKKVLTFTQAVSVVNLFQAPANSPKPPYNRPISVEAQPSPRQYAF